MGQGVEGLLGSTRSSEEARKHPPLPPLGASLVLSSKEPACNAEDSGSIPGSGRSPGEGNGDPLQYSGLESPMHRGLSLAG